MTVALLENSAKICNVYILRNRMRNLENCISDFTNILHILALSGVEEINICTENDTAKIFNDILNMYNQKEYSSRFKLSYNEEYLDICNENNLLLVLNSGVHFIFAKNTINQSLLSEIEEYKDYIIRSKVNIPNAQSIPYSEYDKYFEREFRRLKKEAKLEEIERLKLKNKKTE